MTNLLQRSRRTLAAPLEEFHTFNGNEYWGLPQIGLGTNEEGISADFATLVARAYKANAVIYACEMTRVALFSEARFKWRRLTGGRPGDLFGTPDLDILERPWPAGTTGSLLGRMLLDADFGGTAFVARPADRPERLMRMRPDWVTIVLGSQSEPDEARVAMDADFVGVLYYPGGPGSGRPAVPLLADEVAVFAPTPDPAAAYRGVSWLAPVLTEVKSDAAATAHKLMFFENGASPQLVVSMGPNIGKDQFRDFVAKADAGHRGVSNAYKTFYIGGGATVTPVGADLRQLDFKATQGAGETRIAAASGVHPVVAALSEGMAGSSLNAGNFNAAKRLVADRTLRPLWRSACAALTAIVPAPPGAELWFDDRDISFLQEDRKDAADIEFVKAQTIRQLIEAGFDAATVVAAVEAEDMGLLKHTGLTSVQLQEPAATPGQAGSTNGKRPAITVGGQAS